MTTKRRETFPHGWSGDRDQVMVEEVEVDPALVAQEAARDTIARFRDGGEDTPSTDELLAALVEIIP